MPKRLLPVLCCLLLFTLAGCRREAPAPDASTAEPGASAALTAPTPLAPPAMLALDGEEDTQAGVALSAAETNENVILLTNGAHLSLSESDLNKLGDSPSVPEAGGNACVRVLSGSTFTLSASSVTTGAVCAPGLFASGSGSAVSAVDSILAASGASSAAAQASDAGVITFFGTALMAEGADSPCLIAENGAISLEAGSMSAASGPFARLSGSARVTLQNVDLASGSFFSFLPGEPASDDASVLQITGGYLGLPGDSPLLQSENAHCEVRMENVTLTEPIPQLARAAGGSMSLTLVNQRLSGRIEPQDGAEVHLSLTSGSRYTGAFPGGSVPAVSLTLDETSAWEVTGETYLSVFKTPDTSFPGISSNGFNVYYDSSRVENVFLNAQSYPLPGGGRLIPII